MPIPRPIVAAERRAAGSSRSLYIEVLLIRASGRFRSGLDKFTTKSNISQKAGQAGHAPWFAAVGLLIWAGRAVKPRWIATVYVII
jgi:hypothetical protein